MVMVMVMVMKMEMVDRDSGTLKSLFVIDCSDMILDMVSIVKEDPA